MEAGGTPWQGILFGGAALLVVLRAWTGWRLGVVRQGVSILALIFAYVGAFLGGPLLVPILRPLGYPDKLLSLGGGAIIGTIIYLGISIASAILFKKTSDQSVGLVRLGYGGLGALLGAVSGMVLVWLGFLGIRVLGTLAEVQSGKSGSGKKPSNTQSAPPNAIVHGLVGMKQVLSEGTSGAVMEHLDPVPGTVYSTVSKVGQMVSSQQNMERFQNFPGVRVLAQNPKILALGQDPEIGKALANRDFFGLLHNERIVAAANDREVAALLGRFPLEKALDYALGKPENREPLPAGRAH